MCPEFVSAGGTVGLIGRGNDGIGPTAEEIAVRVANTEEFGNDGDGDKCEARAVDAVDRLDRDQLRSNTSMTVSSDGRLQVEPLPSG